MTFLFGGDTGYESTHGTVDVYDDVNGQWSVGRLSVPRSWGAAAEHGDRVCFAGGGQTTERPSDAIGILQVDP